MARKRESLLAHCILNAARVLANEDVSSGRKKADQTPSAWDVIRVGVKAQHKGSRVAAFIVLWAVAVDELGEGTSHAEVQRWMAVQSSATFYRKLAEFRELFPGEDDPERIALMLLRQARGKKLMSSGQSLAVAL